MAARDHIIAAANEIKAALQDKLGDIATLRDDIEQVKAALVTQKNELDRQIAEIQRSIQHKKSQAHRISIRQGTAIKSLQNDIDVARAHAERERIYLRREIERERARSAQDINQGTIQALERKISDTDEEATKIIEDRQQQMVQTAATIALAERSAKKEEQKHLTEIEELRKNWEVQKRQLEEALHDKSVFLDQELGNAQAFERHADVIENQLATS